MSFGLNLGVSAGLGRQMVPWTPASLSTAPALWLSADTGVTQAAGAVSAWLDRSANAYSFQQATAANQPVYSATGFNGNRAAVTGDGTNDFLRSSVNFAPIAGGFIVFAVFDNWSTGRLFRDAGDANATLYTAGTGAFTLFNGDTSNVAVVGTHSDPHIVVFNSGTLANSRVNGAAATAFGVLGTGPVGASGFAMDLFSTGGTNASNCALADLIMASSMTLADQQQLEGWSAHKNGVTSLLPAGHPYKSAAPML